MKKVLKFGGTSVGSAENMRKVAAIIRDERATVTVLSAMSGTTDALLKISTAAANGDKPIVDEQIEFLRRKYSECVGELINDHAAEANAAMDQTFAYIASQADAYEGEDSEHNIVAQGELLTTAIFTIFLQESGMKAELLYAPAFMAKDADLKVKTDLLRKELATLTADKDTYYITQGFICVDHNGIMDNLGRGGSDYSAALIGAAIDAGEVQIWTDIDGMHNNDPRIVSNTRPIRKMSFDEAAELAYFGAKILHPATTVPCKERGIPVKLKNTMDPRAEGTTISADEDDASDFHAVAAKDGITVIRIYSTRMLMAYGFLRKVFEIFEDNKTSIDMITTSEVAVSLTIDSDCHLDKIVAELNQLGKIEVEKENTIVCVAGKLEHGKRGLAAKVMDSLSSIPIKMISYGASHHSIALLVATKDKKETLQSLNDCLFQ